MKRLAHLVVILLALSATPAAGAEKAPLWSVEAASSVGFVARQAGAPVEGRFEGFTAEVRFDPANLEASVVAVEIDIASVNSESSDRDQVIRSADLFDVARFPTARFAAPRFAKAGDGFEAQGSLTLRDVTREVVLPFTLTVEDHPADPARLRAHAVGELTIKRLDYGVGQGQWTDTSVVADEVVILIDIVASRPKP